VSMCPSTRSRIENAKKKGGRGKHSALVFKEGGEGERARWSHTTDGQGKKKRGEEKRILLSPTHEKESGEESGACAEDILTGRKGKEDALLVLFL